jgi:hypothetical protein
METFLALNGVLTGFAVVIAAVSNYLIINKLWTRRTKKDVAESISISAALLGLATGLPFFIEFVLVEPLQWAAAGKAAIGIGTGVVFVLVGSGLWVAENRGQGFFKLFTSALHLEGKESGDLVKVLVQPTGAKELIEVFEAMAAVDKHIDAREIEMIEEFAHRWRVEPPSLTEGATGSGDIVTLRRSVEAYLAISPPPEQAEELLDVLHLFVQADAKVSPEEELVLEELAGMITQYVTGKVGEHDMFEVVIVPQNDEQLSAVQSILPGVVAKPARGGMVFSAGRFFSSRYAEAVCEKYIALGLFTARVDA